MRNFLQALDQKHAKLFKKKKESRKSVLTRHQASRNGRHDPSLTLVQETLVWAQPFSSC
jgi:predicted RNA-binding protein